MKRHLCMGLLATLPSWLAAQTLQLQVSESVDVPHQTLTLSFGTQATGTDVAALNAQVSQRIQQAQALGQAQAPVRLVQLQTQPVYDSKGLSGKVQVRALLQVSGDNLNAVNQVGQQLASRLTFEGMQYGITEAQRMAAHATLTQALGHALMNEAQNMGRALGYGRVALISAQWQRGEAPPVRPTLMRAMAADAATPDWAQTPGSERVSSTLSGELQLLDPLPR